MVVRIRVSMTVNFLRRRWHALSSSRSAHGGGGHAQLPGGHRRGTARRSGVRPARRRPRPVRSGDGSATSAQRSPILAIRKTRRRPRVVGGGVREVTPAFGHSAVAFRRDARRRRVVTLGREVDGPQRQRLQVICVWLARRCLGRRSVVPVGALIGAGLALEPWSMISGTLAMRSNTARYREIWDIQQLK